jgi:2-polyprenyl-3-methyl-5-hydroxy-6-metoxy-1,4-benzoquinol methylase
MLSHYHSAIDLGVENDSHTWMLRMVGSNKRVLEAGCASGHMSEMLVAQGCSVVGIEIDDQVAHVAEQWVERVVVGNFDDDVLWEELEGEHFDVILFGDVLEHLHDPLKTVRASLEHLRPSGMIVISVPNIAHADVKIALLNGSFPYRESGLLDKTHIHFFTKESLLELVQDAGLAATEFERVTVPVFATEIGVAKESVDDEVLAAFLHDREAETYQFVLKAVRDDGARSVGTLSDRLVDLSDRLRDEALENVVLRARLEALQRKHDEELQDLAHLRQQMRKVKRVLPMGLIRLTRRIFKRNRSSTTPPVD